MISADCLVTLCRQGVNLPHQFLKAVVDLFPRVCIFGKLRCQGFNAVLGLGAQIFPKALRINFGVVRDHRACQPLHQISSHSPSLRFAVQGDTYSPASISLVTAR